MDEELREMPYRTLKGAIIQLKTEKRKLGWFKGGPPPIARLEAGVFRGGVDKHRTPSPQTRASHGTKMMPPEALAEAYGRKEWKHFMSDTGMACRSGMAPAGWRGRDCPLHFGPWTCGVRLGGTPSCLLRPGCTREPLWLDRSRMCFPHVSDVSVAVDSALFQVLLILLLLALALE